MRDTLIAHAASALATGGPGALSLRSVAGAAGTSTNAVYTLFGGKDGLIEAAVATAFNGFTAAQRAVGHGPDPVADLRALGRAYRSWALAHLELYAVMFGGRVPLPAPRLPVSDAGDDTDEAIDPLVSVVLRLLREGVFAGEPDEIVATIWASVHGMVALELAVWGDRPEADRERLYEAQLTASVRAWRVGCPDGTPTEPVPQARRRRRDR